jgi:hypothetical protein
MSYEPNSAPFGDIDGISVDEATVARDDMTSVVGGAVMRPAKNPALVSATTSPAIAVIHAGPSPLIRVSLFLDDSLSALNTLTLPLVQRGLRAPAVESGGDDPDDLAWCAVAGRHRKRL